MSAAGEFFVGPLLKDFQSVSALCKKALAWGLGLDSAGVGPRRLRWVCWVGRVGIPGQIRSTPGLPEAPLLRRVGAARVWVG